MSTSEMLEIREKLIQIVKAAGETLINDAEDIVGEGEKLCNLNIQIDIRLDDVPTIFVSREYPINPNVLSQYMMKIDD